MDHQKHSVARIWSRFLVVLTLALTLWVGAATSAFAVAGQSQVGTGTAASCTFQSLNSALANAFDPLLVTFNCGTNPVVIDVTSTITPSTRTAITIDGGTPGLITLNGTSVRIINQAFVTNLTVKNLTFTGGSASGCNGACGGGAISNPNGSLTVIDCTFSGNIATFAALGPPAGGAILSGGPLTVTGSTFTNNQALGGNGGAIWAGTATIANTRFSNNASTGTAGAQPAGLGGALYMAPGPTGSALSMQITSSVFTGNTAGNVGGAIYKAASTRIHSLSVANSTFSGNSALVNGGALGIGSTFGIGTVKVTNATIAGNSVLSGVSGTGAGIWGSLTTLTNTIVSNNTPGGNCSASVPDGGGNVVYGDTTCPGTNADPALGTLTGALPYFPLGTGSAAINRGIGAACAASIGSPDYGAGGVDQRGILRRSPYCDSGAFEAQVASLAVIAGSNQSAAINAPFAAVLQAQTLDSFNNKLAGAVVMFTGPANGTGIVNGGISLSGLGGVAFLAPTANGTVGAYNVSASATGATAVNFGLTNRYPNAVTYSGNGNTSGSVPIDGNYYPTSGIVTVSGNSGGLARINSTFAGWNTAADGTGTAYAGGAAFAIATGLTLYAQWTPVTRGVAYNANGSTGGTVPADGSAYAPGAAVTVLGNTGALVKSGATFAGWNSTGSGTGVNYPASGSSFAMGSNNITLYAQWSNPCTLDVDGNNQVDPLTDGLMLLRAMFGLTGTAVTNGAIGSGTPARPTWDKIQPYLNANCGTSFLP